MKPADKTDRSQTDSIAFEFDLPHPPEKVWRALTDPDLLAQWLLPVIDLISSRGRSSRSRRRPTPAGTAP